MNDNSSISTATTDDYMANVVDSSVDSIDSSSNSNSNGRSNNSNDSSDDNSDEFGRDNFITSSSRPLLQWQTLRATQQLIPVLRNKMFGKETRAPKTHHNRIDWCDHVMKTGDNNTFHTRHHTSYDTFNKLVELLHIEVDEKQSTRSTSGNDPISPNHIVAAALRYLCGSKTVDVADILGTSDSSVDRILNLFLDKVIDCKALQVKLPTGDALRTVMNGFRNISTAGDLFKGCVGAIDGWLAQINKPNQREVENVADYHSGHYHCYGLNAMAVCDSRLRFTYFAVAGTGRTNDNRALFRLGRLQQWMDELPVDYFLIGDKAFTVSNKTLVPFFGAQRTLPNKDVYNFYLSQLQIRIDDVNLGQQNNGNRRNLIVQE
jgi:DDE superfamily endonuclease